MRLEELMGKYAARLSVLTEEGYTDGDDLLDYDASFVLVDDNMELSFSAARATDWIEKPAAAYSLTERALIEAWNGSLPAGATADNRAPNSARFNRFLERVKNATARN